MVYEVSVFKSWPTYASWADLKSWLVSADGGLLRVVEPPNSSYAVVRYNKQKSNFSLEHVRWCRSVIVHKDSRLPVCVAPPMASPLTDNSVNEATVAEEFVDGTMLNVFHAACDDSATVATRSRLGGDKSFYAGGMSFRAMFDDAMATQGVASFGDMLPKDGFHRFTSVVLQHPLNRIVKKYDKASFAIVHQGWVAADGSVSIEEDAANFNYVSSNENDDSEIQPYNLESIRAAKTDKSWVSAQAQERGLGWQGLVLKDGKGSRWRIRSDVYETIHGLRGNESTQEERYSRLRKSRSVDQYLAFYPEDTELFYKLEGLLRKNTRQLSYFYSDVFRSRKVQFYELPWPYKHHVSVLHNYYKNVLRASKKHVDLNEVVTYVNSLNLEDTANMLKEHKLDLKKADVPSLEKVSVEETVVA